MSRSAIALGLLTGMAGVAIGLSPLGGRLEEEIGLPWLFTLRGVRAPPPHVLVVTLDRESQIRLGLPPRRAEWPRSRHATLVRTLARARASVVVFDMHFARERDGSADRDFAEAIRDAGRVVLFESLRKESAATGTATNDDSPELVIETLAPPASLFAEAAFGLAPFPLPKVPARVSQFWLFKPGDTPTLPVTALLVHALPVYDDLLHVLKRVAPQAAAALPQSARAVREAGSVNAVAAELRALFRANPGLAAQLFETFRSERGTHRDAPDERLSALVTALDGPPSQHLNFYGPAATIRTIPYHEIVDSNAPNDASNRLDLDGITVFVGVAERDHPDQEDGFYTVYSQPSGIDLSGVEIAATAFGNLLERRPVHTLTLPLYLGIVMAWGWAVGGMLRLLPGFIVVPCALALAFAYLGLGHVAFARAGVWLPVVVPLLVQVPLAMTGALLWTYLDARHDRSCLRRAFNYHLPSAIVDELVIGDDGLEVTSRKLYGVCLYTDVQDYTSVSEPLDPTELQRLINLYFETIFAPIRRHGGVVADVHGDATLAVWAATESDPLQKHAACLAAIEVAAAVQRFNALQGKARFGTRVGLHAGEIILGHVGGLDHYEYRAVGDTVNAAARIEGLNKRMNTRILVSAETIDGVHGLCTRGLGQFLLVGKRRPLVLHELVDTLERVSPERVRCYERFALGLQAFQARDWSAAAAAFRYVLEHLPDDGPSGYYLGLCDEYQTRSPPEGWNGTIVIAQK